MRDFIILSIVIALAVAIAIVRRKPSVASSPAKTTEAPTQEQIDKGPSK